MCENISGKQDPGEQIIIDVVFRSVSGRSLAEKTIDEPIDLEAYAASREVQDRAVHALEDLGFELVGSATQFGVTVKGSRKLVETIFGAGSPEVPETLTAWIDSARYPQRGSYFS